VPVLALVVTALFAAQTPSSPADEEDPVVDETKTGEEPVEEPVEEPAQPDADSLVENLFAGRWLDPTDPYWKPRRGERFELSLLLGGEAAFETVSTDKLPSLGGMVLNSLGRYYPVDRLAVVFGWRTYVGLDGVPATGTTAATVVSLITGIRYDLVRENRFSLLWDLYSGPSLYVFADLPTTDLVIDTTALGGEMGTGLALRYSVGPVTGEARGLVGGRAGAASSPLDGSGGPFSAVYAGIDVGFTWSLQ
jgi:hypothetical protein